MIYHRTYGNFTGRPWRPNDCPAIENFGSPSGGWVTRGLRRAQSAINRRVAIYLLVFSSNVATDAAVRTKRPPVTARPGQVMSGFERRWALPQFSISILISNHHLRLLLRSATVQGCRIIGSLRACGELSPLHLCELSLFAHIAARSASTRYVPILIALFAVFLWQRAI